MTKMLKTINKKRLLKLESEDLQVRDNTEQSSF